MIDKLSDQIPYNIDCLSTPSQLDALQKEWSELIKKIPDVPIFQTWEWIKTWWLYFSEKRQLCILTARDQNGALLGIAPLMHEVYQKGPIKLNTLTYIGTGQVCPTHLKILLCPEHLECISHAFIRYLREYAAPWDILRISSVVSDSPEKNMLVAMGGITRIGSQIPTLFIPLPNNWDAYLKTIGRKFRRVNINSRQKLEGDYPGQVRFSCITEHNEAQHTLEKLEELIKQRCHSKGIPTAWDAPAFTQFHRSIASIALDRGWLRLYTLTVKDQLIAIIYNLNFNDCAFGYNMGYDARWGHYNPGRILIAYSIESAIMESVNIFDMGHGDTEYKYSWTDHVKEEEEILFSNTWKGKLWITIGNMERGVRIKTHHLLARVPRESTK
jgi:CelD/BcsL family acetyltransferase involved in cellulose biosynthesis